MDEIKNKNVIIVAGNIGAGKSTLLEYLRKNGKFSNFEFVKEFIDKSWRNLFYSDRKRYTGPFEMSCLMGRRARYLTAKNGEKSVFFDRGLIESRETFVQNSFDEGFMSFEELEDYDKRFKKALDEFGRTKEDIPQWMEILIVYLKTAPKTCFDRQKKRIEEKKDFGEIIPLEYFERIHEYYENFMNHLFKTYQKWGLPLTPHLLVIDANQDLENNLQYHEEIAQMISNRLNEINKTSNNSK